MTLEGYASNYDEPNLLPENIKNLVTIFGVEGTLSGGGPVLPSGNGFVSSVWEQILDWNSPGAQNYLGLLAMYDDGTNAYWFHGRRKVQNSGYTNGYIKCVKVNKTTGVVNIYNSGDTMYVLSSGGTPGNGTPDQINVNGTQVGFLFAPRSYNFSCVAGSYHSGLITFDTSTNTRSTYTYHQDVATCGGFGPYFRGDLTFPGTALIGGSTYATVMGTSMTILGREITGNNFSLYDQLYFSL